MTLQFIEGFDDGIVANNLPGKWGKQDWAVNATYGRNGSGARALTNQASMKKPIEAHQTQVIGLAMRFQSFHSTSDSHLYANLIFRGDNDGTEHVKLTFLTTSISVFRGTAKVAAIPHSMTLNVWHYVEVKVVLDDTSGAVVVEVDQSEVGRFDGDTRNGGTNATLDTITVFQYGTSTTSYSVFDMDDLYICNGAGTSHNDFLGDHRVDTVLPSGNGNYSQLVGSDADSTDNYLLVDENPPNTADYVGSSTDGNKDTYLFGDAPAGRTIGGVQTVQFSVKTDTGAKAMRQVARIGTTDYAGSDHVLGQSYQAHIRAMGVSPDTSTDWTEAEFNGAEFGVEVQP